MRTPPPEHSNSIWNTFDDVVDHGERRWWSTPATPEMLADAEARLGVKIPAVLRAQLAIQNGGPIFLNMEAVPFEDNCPFWTNAIVDWLEPLQEWELAADNHWFDEVSDVSDLNLLVIFASHAESFLCLDYRSSGEAGTPGVVYIDVCTSPTEVTTVAETVDQFVHAIIKSKTTDGE